MAFVTAMLRHKMVATEQLHTVLIEMADDRVQTIRARLKRCEQRAA